MARFRVDLKGEEELFKKLRTLRKTMQKKIVRQAQRPAFKIVEQTAKAIVPVETGRLRRSIKTRAVKRSRKRFGVMVRTDVPYAAPVEFGHMRKDGSFVRPRSFLRHSFRIRRPRVKKTFIEQVRAGIRRVVR